MIIRTVIFGGIGVFLGIFQSTFLFRILPQGVVPDLALILVIVSAWNYGSLTGELTGFIVGIGIDAMSSVPWGFHAFLFTLAGYVFGRFRGNVRTGFFIVPAIAALSSTLIKYGGAFLLTLIYKLSSSPGRFFSWNLLWEMSANMIIAPVFFLVVSTIQQKIISKRGGFN